MNKLTEYTFDDLQENSPLFSHLVRLIESNQLVPIIGAGFSAEGKTESGTVPSAERLCEVLVDIIIKHDSFISDTQRNQLRKAAENRELSSIAAHALRIVEDSDAASQDLREFVQENFLGVHDLEEQKRLFINCGWKYLYTLNYDDAIENLLRQNSHRDFATHLPYRKIDRRWSERRGMTCLIKLHGDAGEYARTGDTRYLVLTKKQYASLIQDSNNATIRAGLQEDLSSKALLFVGCSLTDEFDILFENEKYLDGLQSNARENSYYIHYDTNPGEELSWELTSRLQEYGIDNIIRITPDRILSFYSQIALASSHARKIKNDDAFNQYADFDFMYLDASSRNNIDYLYSNKDLLDIENQRVTFPQFVFTRDVESRIISDFSKDTALAIVLGDRFTGKTYVLLNLGKALKPMYQKIYYFSKVQIDEFYFPKLREMKNCVLIFDCESLSSHQLSIFIEDELDILVKNHVKIISAVNTSDSDMMKGLAKRINKGSRNQQRVKTYTVGKRLSDKELSAFNGLIGRQKLTGRLKNESFVDYLIKIDEADLRVSKPSVFTSYNLLGKDRLEFLKCQIVLAHNSIFDTKLAVVYDILSPLEKLCISSEGIVQKDYLPLLQQNPQSHSGMQYAINSTYWIRRCLMRFASDKDNYTYIANAYESIVDSLNSHKYVIPNYHDLLYSYINLDIIQETFFSGSAFGGSLELPKLIFDRLYDTLRDDYQFLHQYAKCILRYSRRVRDHVARTDQLGQAKRCIDRAIFLAENSYGINKEYTVSHMYATSSLIASAFLHAQPEHPVCKNTLQMVIELFYSVYVERAEYLGDYISRDVLDNEDTVWLFSKLSALSPEWKSIIMSSPELREKVEDLLSNKYGKRIVLR